MVKNTGSYIQWERFAYSSPISDLYTKKNLHQFWSAGTYWLKQCFSLCHPLKRSVTTRNLWATQPALLGASACGQLYPKVLVLWCTGACPIGEPRSPSLSLIRRSFGGSPCGIDLVDPDRVATHPEQMAAQSLHSDKINGASVRKKLLFLMFYGLME